MFENPHRFSDTISFAGVDFVTIQCKETMRTLPGPLTRWATLNVGYSFRPENIPQSARAVPTRT